MPSGAKARKHDPNDGYIPFKVRFLAWWEGVEAATMIKADDTDDPIAYENDPNAIVIDKAANEERPAWSKERIAFVRRLWEKDEKDESITPGGADYTVKLYKPMALNSSASALDISAGIGGGIRRAARELDTWITGMEADPDLAALGRDLSERQRMDRKAPVEHFDPDIFELPAKKYDGILAQNTIHRHRNKKRSFDMLYQALKPRGHLLLTDLVLPNEAAANSRVMKAWLERLPEEPFLWTADNYKRALLDHGMDVRVFSDDTDDYRLMVLEGWQRFVNTLKKDDLTREFVDEMMLEAEYWLLLVKVLEFGALRYMRAHAIRGGETA